MLTSLLGGRIMGHRHGRGTPSVVALHGWSRDSSDWSDVLRGEDALALDLPGFGNTPTPDAAWGTPEYAELVFEAIASVTASPVILVGHSFGGRIAAQLAARHPERVAGLVLTGVPLYPRNAPARPRAAFRLARALHRAHLVPDPFMDRMRNRYGSADYRATSGVIRSIFVKVVNEDYHATVRKIADAGLPVYLIWGEHDQEVPVSVATRVNDEIDNAQLRVVSGAGHFIDARMASELRSAIVDSKASTARN